MTTLAFVVFGAFIAVVSLYSVASAALFFHIGRYSYIGDSSKRAFFLYITGGLITILVGIILIMINHLVS